jgi:hypothetical protein
VRLQCSGPRVGRKETEKAEVMEVKKFFVCLFKKEGWKEVQQWRIRGIQSRVWQQGESEGSKHPGFLKPKGVGCGGGGGESAPAVTGPWSRQRLIYLVWVASAPQDLLKHARGTLIYAGVGTIWVASLTTGKEMEEV